MSNRNCFWFGTEDRMSWFPAPLQGADSSPEGWSAGGTLLNGGGWGYHSWGSHKTYTYEWSQASSPEVAQKMKSYRDGSFGRGPLYFLDPTTYKTNILPAHWADPSMALGHEAPSIIPGETPQRSPVLFENVPVTFAYYSSVLSDPVTLAQGPPTSDSVFIPIPEGYTLYLGGYIVTSGSAGVFAQPVNSNGTRGTSVPIPQWIPGIGGAGQAFSGLRGVRLWAGRTSGAVSALIAGALTGRLLKNEDVSNPVKVAEIQNSPWVGGQGHSGCRFATNPTYVTNTAYDGGRIGFAATFREVGSWLYG